MRRIGVDVGGTFTDLVYWDDENGRRLVHKVSTTSANPAEGTARGIAEICEMAGVAAADLDLVLHGTTVATNIILQGAGAKVGLITTEGFRDLLHIARKKRPLNFSTYQDLAWQVHPLVERRHRLSVRERVAGPDGEVVEPLDLEGAREAVLRLKAEGVEAVAVCLLFSFLEPSHERAVRELVTAEFPEAFVSVSNEVAPLYREYERFSTTAVNAYVGPKTARYIDDLSRRIDGLGVAGGLRLMTSAGGVVTAGAAAQQPVILLMSGPAAGLLAGIDAARSTGFEGAITLDVGGTSSDVGVSVDGGLRMKHLLDTKVGGYAVMVPMLDVETVGAGGGSIACVSAQGILDVGPRSAGAFPGPICYSRGGQEPTVTDALAALGWLRPAGLLGGELKLDVEAARAGIDAMVAKPLGLGLEAAALGVHTVCAHNMANAVLQLSVRKGHDPRRLALVAQGGAGPAFGCTVGAIVGAHSVIVPPHPGIASAFGLLSTDLRYEFAATVWQLASAPDTPLLGTKFDELTEQARRRLRADGLQDAAMDFELSADCRYLGQGYELRVSAGPGPFGSAWVARLVKGFHEAHERIYQRRFDESEVQIVNIRAVGVGRLTAVRLREAEMAHDGDAPFASPVAHAEAYFAGSGWTATPVFERSRLPAGGRLEGPAIIEQLDSTTIIEPGFAARVHATGCLVIRLVDA